MLYYNIVVIVITEKHEGYGTSGDFCGTPQLPDHWSFVGPELGGPRTISAIGKVRVDGGVQMRLRIVLLLLY